MEENQMTINKTQNNSELVVALCGRLDTTSAPMFEAELKKSLNDIRNLSMDFAELEYISSAGLRVLLSAQKVMNKQGKMRIRNANASILEVFEITGFSDILTIDE
jgi:anti-anti-sigma factor